jgi:hypothetical protein
MGGFKNKFLLNGHPFTIQFLINLFDATKTVQAKEAVTTVHHFNTILQAWSWSLK